MTSVREDHAGRRDGRGPVLPTAEDPVAVTGSEALGGPPGRRLVVGRGWWTPLRVMALAVIAMFALGMVQKYPCYDGAWFFGANAQYTHACYSDIPHLFQGRGFADGLVPYFDKIPSNVSGGMDYLEYPVLTGALMQLAAWFTPDGGSIQDREQAYWMANASLLMICAVVVVVAVARTHRRRPWDALLVALAPALALNATINWDLLAVALTAIAMYLWSRGRTGWAGVLIGLATAAKLYPVLLLGPLLVLCLRAGRMRDFGRALWGAVAAWVVVNLPFILLAPQGWAKFYTFSQERGEDYGSFWLILMQQRGQALDGLNTYCSVAMLVICAAIGVLALSTRRRPRLAQLAFLVVAAFVLTNKVYSPQYVLWLIPLAALARPRWRDFLIWQAAEVMYFLGVWLYLANNIGDKHQGLPEGGYHAVIAVHLLGTLYLCAMVVRDMLHPEHDPVRQDGTDDPSGGPLDGARDHWTLTRPSPGPLEKAQYVHWGTTSPGTD
ncbi:membrane protein [Wenjunlia tyrosinilytica]|uniref:Membrane protein n=2 Tax=Wenjunlia tyrosinilytica TaxID=1544741 RepID=A0A918DW74_9ACTN|nr:glycosyltransferase 87 family protein [Wenjunlia tyrosinilytica]GGO86268.1 membrane protein [Wenjunlia tyrosinilytica]